MAVELERVYRQICLDVEEPGDENELGERENGDEDEDFSHSLLPAELLDGDKVEFQDDGVDSFSPNFFAVSKPSVQQASRNPHSICNSGTSFEPITEKQQMQQLDWGQLPTDGAFSEGWRDLHIAGNRQSNISGFNDTHGWPSEPSFITKTKNTACDFSLWNFDPAVNPNCSANDCFRAPSSPSLLRLQKDYGIVSDHSDTSPTSVLPGLMSSSEGTGEDSLSPSRVNGVAHRRHFREEKNKWKLSVSSSCNQTEDDKQSTDWPGRELSPPLICLEKSSVDASVFSISSPVPSPSYSLLSPNRIAVSGKKEIPPKSSNTLVLEACNGKPSGVLSGSPNRQRPQHQSTNHVPLSTLNHVNPGTSPNTIIRENKEQVNEARGNNMRLGKHGFPGEIISSEMILNPPSSGASFPGARKVVQNNISSVEKQSIRIYHEREGSHGVISRSHAPCPSTFIHSPVPNPSAIHVCNSSWPKKNYSLTKSFNGNASGSVRTVASSFRAEGGPGGLGRNGGDPSFVSRGRCINQPAVNGGGGGGGGTGVFLPRTAAEVPVQLGRKGQRRSRVFLPSRLVATLGLNLDGNNNVILNCPNSPAFDAPSSPTAFVPQQTSSSYSSSSSSTTSILSH